jgi:hypothetical protein
VRGARETRSNPAEAVPGIRPEDRRTVADHTGTPPTPRVGGTVRGTMGKPQLPRRRAQQHIVPQLRGGPAFVSRQDPDHYVGHDPGLMAAFQRGIGLAEARQMESSDWDAAMLGTASMDLTPPDASSRVESGRRDTAHVDSPSRTRTSHTDALHMELAHMDGPHKDAAQPLGGPTRGTAPLPAPTSALDTTHDLTTRQDGSTPAG